MFDGTLGKPMSMILGTIPKLANLIRIRVRREVLYALALFVLVVLSAGERIVIQRTASLNGSIGSLVSVAERQRLLAERTALVSLSLVSASEQELVSYFKGELSAIAAELSRNHAALIHGDPNLKLTGALSAPSRNILFAEPDLLDGKFDDFLVDVRALAESEGQLEPDNPHLRTVLTGSRTIEKGLGSLVDAEIAEHEKAVERLGRLEALLTMLCVGLLASLGWIYIRLPKDGAFFDIRLHPTPRNPVAPLNAP